MRWREYEMERICAGEYYTEYEVESNIWRVSER